jgi:hypothetical protein
MERMTMVKKNLKDKMKRRERCDAIIDSLQNMADQSGKNVRRCKSFVSLDVNDDFDEMGDENYDNKSLGHGNHFGKSRNHRHEGTKKDGQFIQ